MRLTVVVLALAALIFIGTQTSESDPFTTSAPQARAQRTPVKVKHTAPPLVRAPAQTAPVTTESQQWMQKIAKIELCFESQNCNYPQTDPRSYELAVSQDIAAQLREFKKRFLGTKEYELLARKYIKSADGFSQEAALEMLAMLPPTPENLAAMTEGLNGTPDATLMRQALSQLKRYLGTPMENQVHEFLRTTITTGAHFSSEVASEGIFPFINNQSYPLYRQAIQTLPAGSTALRNLSSALKEYSRLRTGA